MVVQDDHMSLSSFTANDSPVGKGSEIERMWNSMSDIDSTPFSKPDEFLPLRPEVRKKRVTASIQHKQRGHNRPDDWLGKKSSRRSWKVKTITDVANKDLEENDNESQDTQSVLLSLPDELEEQANGKPDLKYDSQHEDTKKVPDFVLPVRGLELSMHSSLTEASDAREMGTSMSSLDHIAIDEASKQSNDDDSFSVKSEESGVSSTRDSLRMWQSMSAINTSFAFDSKHNDKVDNSTRPKLKSKAASSAKGQSEVQEKDQKPKQEPSEKYSKTSVLPDFEMSLSSLDIQSLESIKEDEIKKMWNSTSMIDSSDASRQCARVTRLSHDPKKHKFRAHNRPNDWLGPQAKPSRKSWTAKRIVESSELLDNDKLDETTLLPHQEETNTETESETEATSAVSMGFQMKRAAPREMEKEEQHVVGSSPDSLKSSSRGDLMKESGNLANPVTVSMKADSSPTLSIKLRSTPNGSRVKQGDDIVRKSCPAV